VHKGAVHNMHKLASRKKDLKRYLGLGFGTIVLVA
jgi:hypothetical protein